jgi:lipoyl(octanoyl) transferase|tara:strand:- start:915 stop:1619 length:705 start_codon:yes stop_codon:yes gene_type:complete
LSNSKKVIVRNLGSVDFEESFKIQKQIQNEIIDIKLNNRKNNLNLSTPNYLLFMEHNHVYTLGNSGDDKNLLFNEKELDKKGIKFIKTNRGGDITYHGPGQLVCYPIFDLENFYTDIHRYLRDLEEIIVGTLDHFGIVAFGNPNETGVWLDIGSKNERKICAMGIKVSRWVTMHGLALNVNTDLSYFEGIIPCGINNKGVTSINNELSQKVDLKKVREIMIKNFEKKFNVIIDS